jgi:hypothetical protein
MSTQNETQYQVIRQANKRRNQLPTTRRLASRPRTCAAVGVIAIARIRRWSLRAMRILKPAVPVANVAVRDASAVVDVLVARSAHRPIRDGDVRRAAVAAKEEMRQPRGPIVCETYSFSRCFRFSDAQASSRRAVRQLSQCAWPPRQARDQSGAHPSPLSGLSSRPSSAQLIPHADVLFLN